MDRNQSMAEREEMNGLFENHELRNKKTPETAGQGGMLQQQNKAQMTIYLTLVLAVIIPLLLTVIEGAKVSATKVLLECVTDMGMNSILAEYQRELLDEYGLLFVDTAYGAERGSLEYTKEHLTEYMSYNLRPKKGLFLPGARDFYKVRLESLDFTGEARATDENGKVFEYMAVSYMLEKYGAAYVKDFADLVQVTEENRFLEKDILKENEKAQERIRAIKLPEPEEGKEWSEAAVENPTEGVSKVREGGVLWYVCKKPVSGKSVSLSQYASKRNLVEGSGLWEEWEDRFALEEQLLLNEYFMQKSGNYIAPKENGCLDYQTEYLICGKANDTENLKGVIDRLLLVRGASNSAYFAADDKMKKEAEIAATALAIVTEMPPLKDVYKTAIIAAWIYSESVYDVKLLMDGQKVPLVKQQGDWNLALENALQLSEKELGIRPNRYGEGLTYEDYLRLLLYATDAKKKTFRMMDLIEMDIRRTPGAGHFKMDDCVAAFKFQAVFKSSYGYSYLLKREAGYD